MPIRMLSIGRLGGILQGGPDQKGTEEIEKGFDPTYGARPMRRAVERYLEDPMAEEILRGSFKAGDKVQVTRDGEKLSFKVSGGTPPAKAKKAKG